MQTELVANDGMDPSAVAELLLENRPVCLRIATRLLGTSADAEDAVQEAYLKAFCCVASFEMRAAFRSWLIRILINECYLLLRRRQRARCVSMQENAGATLASFPSSSRTPEELHIDKELMQILRLHVRRLPPSFRQPLLMQVYEELTLESVAQRLGLKLEATKTRIRRARLTLRTRLHPYLHNRIRMEPDSETSEVDQS
jgi:RNA polymerase sigma-70 factor, ECF subfamily